MRILEPATNHTHARTDSSYTQQHHIEAGEYSIVVPKLLVNSFDVKINVVNVFQLSPAFSVTSFAFFLTMQFALLACAFVHVIKAVCP